MQIDPVKIRLHGRSIFEITPNGHARGSQLGPDLMRPAGIRHYSEHE